MDWIAAARTLSKIGLCEPVFAALAADGLANGNQDGDKAKWRVALHGGGSVNIVLSERRWWDLHREKGGMGPVAALSHVLGLSAPEAARWIVERVEGCPPALALREVMELRQASESGERRSSLSKRIASL